MSDNVKDIKDNDIKDNDIKVNKVNKNDKDIKAFKDALRMSDKDNAIIKHFIIYNNNNTYVKNKVLKLNKSALSEIKNALSDILTDNELKMLKKDISYNNNNVIFNMYNKVIKDNKDLFIVKNYALTVNQYNNKDF